MGRLCRNAEKLQYIVRVIYGCWGALENFCSVWGNIENIQNENGQDDRYSIHFN